VPPKAVISFFGPTDLAALYKDATDLYVQISLTALTGTTPQLHSDTYRQSSPIQFVNSKSCPTLILHGDKDPLVPVSQSQLLKAKLEHKGVVNELVVYPGLGHGWVGSTLTNSFDHLEAFLHQYVLIAPLTVNFFCAFFVILFFPCRFLCRALRPNTLDELVGQEHLTGKGVFCAKQ
jgi:acetyl esterase/lipase